MLGKVRSGIFHFIITGSQQRLFLQASALTRMLRPSHLLPANLSSQQRLLLPASALARTLHPSHLLPTIFKTHIQHLHKRCNEPWHGDVAEHSFCNSGCMILQVAFANGATSLPPLIPWQRAGAININNLTPPMKPPGFFVSS